MSKVSCQKFHDMLDAEEWEKADEGLVLVK